MLIIDFVFLGHICIFLANLFTKKYIFNLQYINSIVFRRDSINGLRIVSKLDQSEAEALDGLGEIALTEEKEEFSKFQTDALKTHNKYRAR